MQICIFKNTKVPKHFHSWNIITIAHYALYVLRIFA